jgi:methionyl-tRNA synthetase
MNLNKILVTSALPYVNNVPHLGNIIGCVLSADVYARYKRTCGKDVLYICGTDEYGTTTEIKAKQENITCQKLCDKYHKLHKEIYEWFNISFDFFGRTTTDTHAKMTQEMFTALYKNGHIEEKKTKQFYCNECDMFLADRYIKGICYHGECNGKNILTKCDQCGVCSNLIDADKIINPQCIICNSQPIIKYSDHLFLKLGDFKNKLKKYFDKDIFLTNNAKGITKSWLTDKKNNKLHSRCITRDLKWGVPIPGQILGDDLTKYKNKVFYVWFDAPIGYYSILKHGMKKSNIYTNKDIEQWLSPNTKLVQFMAKDNVPFHTIMFLSTLFGSNLNYPTINKLSSTEYLNYESTKFSKSNNIGVFGDNVINISNTLDITADYWRYYLLKNRPETTDISFSWKGFVNLCNADLVKNYGNFANRCINMSNKYNNGRVLINIRHKYDDYEEYIVEVQTYLDSYHKNMNSFKFKNALSCAFSISSIGNKFLQQYQPWCLFSNVMKNKDKHDFKIIFEKCKKEINSILGFAIWILYFSSQCLEPFIPDSSGYIINYINIIPKFRSTKDNESVHFISPKSFLECKNKNISSVLLKTKYAMPFKILKEFDLLDALITENINTSNLSSEL